MSGLTVIMGESGTGKTTLIDLICGFYQITKGMMSDSQNIQNINIRSWRNYRLFVTESIYNKILQRILNF